MVILYPTETVYGLGLNALDEASWQKLCRLKAREEIKVASWLVRNVADIETFAVLSPLARIFADRFLPGPLTLVLPARDTVPEFRQGSSGEVSFRISSDPYAAALIDAYMKETGAPLTCTSANVSGLPTLGTPDEIQAQFKQHNLDFVGFDRVIDGGVRTERASTIVRVVDDTYEILREGMITCEALMTIANNL
jgi:L-threonylcarbamoyladenylate synthase